MKKYSAILLVLFFAMATITSCTQPIDDDDYRLPSVYHDMSVPKHLTKVYKTKKYTDREEFYESFEYVWSEGKLAKMIHTTEGYYHNEVPVLIKETNQFTYEGDHIKQMYSSASYYDTLGTLVDSIPSELFATLIYQGDFLTGFLHEGTHCEYRFYYNDSCDVIDCKYRTGPDVIQFTHPAYGMHPIWQNRNIVGHIEEEFPKSEYDDKVNPNRCLPKELSLVMIEWDVYEYSRNNRVRWIYSNGSNEEIEYVYSGEFPTRAYGPARWNGMRYCTYYEYAEDTDK